MIKFVIIKDANPLLLYLVNIFNPLQTSTSVGFRCKRAKGIRDLRQFWPVLAQICFGFCVGQFFLCRETLATFRDQSAMLGEHLSQKLALAHPYNPMFWPKCPPGDRKMGQKI